MEYLDALSKVMPIILLILLGAFFNKKQFIKPDTIQDIRKIVINISLPALLFLAFSQVNIEPRYLIIIVLVFSACFFALLLGRLLQPAISVETPYFPFLLTGFEAGMVGYAIFGAVYGSENIYKFGIIDLGQVLFVFFVLVTFLERISVGPKPFRETLGSFLKTPVIIAILAGITVNQTGVIGILSSHPLTLSLLDTLSLLGGLTTPLVAIVIGYEIQMRPGTYWKPALAIGIRLAIWVPMGLLINHLIISRILDLDTGFQAAVLTMFILPPPFVIPLFMTRAEKQDRDFVLNSLTLATVLTIIAFTIVSVLYPP
jgi:malate permease and related proteins